MGKKLIVALVALAVALALIVALPEEEPEGPPPITAPGVQRMGEARAQQVWAGLPTAPGVQGVECDAEEESCTVRFSGALWSGMDHSLRRETAQRFGIGAAHARRARWTEVVDAATGRRLARYTARSDNVRLE